MNLRLYLRCSSKYFLIKKYLREAVTMEYNKLSDEIIAKLQALVGVQSVVTDAG